MFHSMHFEIGDILELDTAAGHVRAVALAGTLQFLDTGTQFDNIYGR